MLPDGDADKSALIEPLGRPDMFSNSRSLRHLHSLNYRNVMFGGYVAGNISTLRTSCKAAGASVYKSKGMVHYPLSLALHVKVAD